MNTFLLLVLYALVCAGVRAAARALGRPIPARALAVCALLAPLCFVEQYSIGNIPIGAVDSLKLKMATISQGWRFGGTNLGNTRGTYFDNFRMGFVRGAAAPSISQEIWNKYQDQFPFNEGVAPGDNAAFDTTTALVRTGLNIVAPANAPGVVAGDSILAEAPFTGDGVASGVRMDLVFRIDPGPGNYTVKGDRASALVNTDPAHPFFAAYLANNGPYGTPGGHGGTWNKDVWNSARMDSAEGNLYPIVSRGMTTRLHAVTSLDIGAQTCSVRDGNMFGQ